MTLPHVGTLGGDIQRQGVDARRQQAARAATHWRRRVMVILAAFVGLGNRTDIRQEVGLVRQADPHQRAVGTLEGVDQRQRHHRRTRRNPKSLDLAQRQGDQLIIEGDGDALLRPHEVEHPRLHPVAVLA